MIILSSLIHNRQLYGWKIFPYIPRGGVFESKIVTLQSREALNGYMK